MVDSIEIPLSSAQTATAAGNRGLLECCFAALDVDHDGRVCWQEYAEFVGIVRAGSLLQRLLLAFRIYQSQFEDWSAPSPSAAASKTSASLIAFGAEHTFRWSSMSAALDVVWRMADGFVDDDRYREWLTAIVGMLQEQLSADEQGNSALSLDDLRLRIVPLLDGAWTALIATPAVVSSSPVVDTENATGNEQGEAAAVDDDHAAFFNQIQDL